MPDTKGTQYYFTGNIASFGFPASQGGEMDIDVFLNSGNIATPSHLGLIEIERAPFGGYVSVYDFRHRQKGA